MGIAGDMRPLVDDLDMMTRLGQFARMDSAGKPRTDD
jgi:hypothetical protein